MKKWFWSYHRLNIANRTWRCRTISQLPFDMHIDTNAQNCNFLSEFVSLRGSLSCQWIVRCAALSLSSSPSLSISLSRSPSLFSSAPLCECPEKGFPPDSRKMEKDRFQNGGKTSVNFHEGPLHKKHIFCQHLNLHVIEVGVFHYLCKNVLMFFRNSAVDVNVVW